MFLEIGVSKRLLHWAQKAAVLMAVLANVLSWP